MGARRLTPLLVVLVLAGARPAMSHDAVAEFGPREFVRTRGHPTTVTERFAVCGPERAFRLRVVAGPGRRHRVRVGTILLNGVEIVGPSNPPTACSSRWPSRRASSGAARRRRSRG
jgi:hypothetical protein